MKTVIIYSNIYAHSHVQLKTQITYNLGNKLLIILIRSTQKNGAFIIPFSLANGMDHVGGIQVL